MKIPAGSTVLFIGDSITDADRERSDAATWWGAHGLGQGYVALLHAWLVAARPEAGLRILNRGISGNTVVDLEARWQRDVLDLQPDWLSVMIGINDVWRQFDSPEQTDQHVKPERFERTLNELLRQTRPQLKGLVLATPFFVEPNRADPMRQMADQYGDLVRKAARQHKAILVDTQAAFDAVLRHVPVAALAPDRVHPTPLGSMVLARAFLAALDAC